jgi:hypothetical protein
MSDIESVDSEITFETSNEIDTGVENDYKNIRTNIETKSISSVYNEYLKELRLFLHPLYQRDFCWSINKMIDFIETIMKGLIVPNFVIYTLSDNEILNMNNTETEYAFECLDGQHRLKTLKHYYENLKYENKHIYWIDNNKNRVFYNMDKSELEKYNKKKHYTYRNLTRIEKRHFDDFQLVIMKVETKTGKELNINIKSDIFNRLQNSEKVSSHIKFRNSKSNITNYIRDNKLLKYLKNIKFQDKCIVKTKKFNEHFNLYFMIRSIIIIYKKSLQTNYLDLNIKKYILERLPCAEIPNNLIPELVEKFKEFVEWFSLKSFNNSDNTKIISEFGYLLVCVFANYNLKSVETLLNSLSDNEFLYYNDILEYKKNRDKLTVTSSETMIKKYEKLIKKI